MTESIRMVMGYKELFLKGLGYTMMVSVEAIIVAVCIGTILTVLRRFSVQPYHSKNSCGVHKFCTWNTDFGTDLYYLSGVIYAWVEFVGIYIRCHCFKFE